MNHPLKNALPIVAAAYGEKFGVNVLIQGQEAYTDGSRIVIPAANPDDPRYQQIAWGYLAHEAAHIRHTDFDVVKASASRPLRKALLNIIEDVRIEAALAQDYPGTRHTIHQVLKHLVEQGQLTVPTDATPPLLFQSWLLFRLRSRLLGQSVLEPLYQTVDAQFSTQLPAGLLTRLSAITTAIKDLACTADSLKVTDAILQLLVEEANKEEEATNPATDDNDGDGEAEPVDERASQSTKPEEETDSSHGTNHPNNDQHGYTEPSAETVTGSVLQQILSATDDDALDDLFAQVASTLEAHAQPLSSSVPLNLPKPEMAQPGEPGILSRAAGESARIRARLRGLVQSSQDKRPQSKHRGRRIDRNRLARSQAGESRLFIKRHPRVAPNAAVHLLVDSSGSMAKALGDCGRQYGQIANEAALALALALEGIPGVSTAVSFFPGITEDVAVALHPRQSVRQHAACFAQSPRGCTPLAPAMWYAANDLLRQKETRKLMIVLTDGEPDDRQATHDIVDRCKRSGFELLGIGIQTRSVERFFAANLVIRDLQDLKHQLFDAAKNLLLRP